MNFRQIHLYSFPINVEPDSRQTLFWSNDCQVYGRMRPGSMEVTEWISIFIPHFIMDAIAY